MTELFQLAMLIPPWKVPAVLLPVATIQVLYWWWEFRKK